MPDHVLITGGAGFIGSHLADELLRRGHQVRVLDNLSPQVHGPEPRRPAYLDSSVELIVGDVRDRDAVTRALRGIDAVYHFAAAVGVGQSMYRFEHYASTNTVGTAVLLEALAGRAGSVRRLVVASSMSVYGEGLYRTREGAMVEGAARSLAHLQRGDWEMRSPGGEICVPIPTPESKSIALESVYALSKYDQEQLVLMAGRAYGIPAIALRFFNVYGPRQALSNPYTGVLAIFASCLLHDRAPQIFEDGHQMRDFVSVHDVARACARALDAPAPIGRVLNIGSGRAHTVLEVADALRRATGKERIAPEVTGRYRMGDVRHCFADIGAALRALGWEPEVTFDEGLAELAAWLGRGAVAPGPQPDAARRELDERGLVL